MDLDAAPTICRYDACTLGPDGGPAPLVQPIRGGNLREYCSDRHRIAAHRSRQRRTPVPSRSGGGVLDAGGPPSEVAARLAALADELSHLSTDVGRTLALGDADRVARELQDAKLRATEAEARVVAATAERDRERAAAAGFREMAEASVTAAERATGRAEDAEAARDGALEAAGQAEAQLEEARRETEAAQAGRAELERALQRSEAELDRARAET
ncbi:MAG: hypothetical protein ACRDZ3_03960, partial [Acidimicrobiia bacterium]